MTYEGAEYSQGERAVPSIAPAKYAKQGDCCTAEW
jgi:hypothetical protein